MPRGTTLRNIRVDDKWWEHLANRAERDGLDRSAAIRALIEGYVCGEFEISSLPGKR